MHRALNDGGSLTEPEKLWFANLLGYAIGAHEAAFMLRTRNLVEAAAYDRSEALSRMSNHPSHTASRGRSSTIGMTVAIL
jgi:hypothetical protein